jgi:hypothetical protein
MATAWIRGFFPLPALVRGGAVFPPSCCSVALSLRVDRIALVPFQDRLAVQVEKSRVGPDEIPRIDRFGEVLELPRLNGLEVAVCNPVARKMS